VIVGCNKNIFALEKSRDIFLLENREINHLPRGAGGWKPLPFSKMELFVWKPS
jgi:hypothetical protein